MVFDDYARAVARVVESLAEPAILVGHSMTSIISQVAEAIPSRIRALVYVAGLLLPNGGAMLDAIGKCDPQYLAQIVWAADGKTARLSEIAAREFMYSRCTPAVLENIIPILTPEPAGPYEARVQTTAENFGRVPRYYVECIHDRVIPIGLQREMYAAIPCKRVFSLEADHCAFFSAPDELCAALLDIAAESAESVVAAAATDRAGAARIGAPPRSNRKESAPD